ncbi:plasmid partitioning protein RepB C-terminal domain-containing protein [Sinorhizobium meliloti]|uniref:plasmid partitioning protein RepB C-terminal domain-containing protein n=1 Tax=Rhizobium meliloti TaxID=382 RepID=UPI001F27FA38|nr:plasmid partitioning protein RepB C-terminal domain-containing protein [Sinorhizobium meliloti]
MERELAALQTQVKSVEETYGIDNLHLTVARGYVAKLLANTRITRWLSYHRQEYFGEFQKIAEIDAIGPQPEARRRKVRYGAGTWPTGITECSRLVRPGSHNVSTGTRRDMQVAEGRNLPGELRHWSALSSQ